MQDSVHPLSDAGEEIFRLKDFAKTVPASVGAIRRWVSVGYTKGNGRVYLEVERHGDIIYTSKEAYERFHRRIRE